MMNLFKLKRKGSSWLRREDGSMAVEAVLILPASLTAIMATYTYFGTFQMRTLAHEGANTVAEYLSRQTDPVNAATIDGLANVYHYMSHSAQTTLRVSSVKYSDDTQSYEIIWSHGSNGATDLATAALVDYESHLPTLSNGETVIMVETTAGWAPVFNVGLDAMTFSDMVAVSPRFAAQVVWEGDTATSTTTTNDEAGSYTQDTSTSDRYYYDGHHH